LFPSYRHHPPAGFPASDRRSITHYKSAAQILPALMTGKSDLRVSFARSLQNSGRKVQVRAPCIQADRRVGNHLGLIEASLAAFGFVERDGNYLDLVLHKRGVQHHDGFRQHAS
jgi:hypothetical protein